MKILYIGIISAAFLIAGCTAGAPPTAQPSNSQNAPMRTERPQSSVVHTTENQTPVPANSNSSGGKFSASGDPIDTEKFDKAIAEAAKTQKAKSADEAAKKALAEAYFDRAFALTEARQYAAALGDYRAALKYDPSHEESQKWIDQIVSIYQMLKKEPPKPGEEPKPLPFKKPASQ